MEDLRQEGGWVENEKVKSPNIEAQSPNQHHLRKAWFGIKGDSVFDKDFLFHLDFYSYSLWEVFKKVSNPSWV